jgi:DNA-binding transcriptional MerR regulator
VKISELSQRTDTPTATIKYYLREGLLPPGEQRGVNQAAYGEPHVRRLQLIRALRDIGRMSIHAIQAVLARVDGANPDTLDVLSTAVDAMALTPVPLTGDGVADTPERRARADVQGFLDGLGYDVRPDAAAQQDLVTALLAIRRFLGPDVPVASFAAYADLTRRLAEQEMAMIQPRLAGPPAEALQAVVMGTVLWEPVILALRRLAHESLTRTQLGFNFPPH